MLDEGYCNTENQEKEEEEEINSVFIVGKRNIFKSRPNRKETMEPCHKVEESLAKSRKPINDKLRQFQISHQC